MLQTYFLLTEKKYFFVVLSSPMVVKQRNILQLMMLKNMFYFNVFCFRDFRNSEKSLRKTFFDHIDEFIPYPGYFEGSLLNEDYSFGIANGEIIIFTFDHQGFVFQFIIS